MSSVPEIIEQAPMLISALKDAYDAFMGHHGGGKKPKTQKACVECRKELQTIIALSKEIRKDLNAHRKEMKSKRRK